MQSRNLMLGTPDGVIAKLTLYQAFDVDEFIYCPRLPLRRAEQKRLLETFCQNHPQVSTKITRRS